MGTIVKILIRDFESCNFDKLVRATLELVHVRKLAFDAVEVVREGDHDVELVGADAEREYKERQGRSMTELYALGAGLGTADASGIVLVQSPIVGLAALCESLAMNHGKVPGVKGGSLYKQGTIPTFSKGLTLLPQRASEIVGRIVKAVAASLNVADPARALFDVATLSDRYWSGLESAMAAASRAVYARACNVIRSMDPERVISVVTDDAEMPKHLWAAIKSVWPNVGVAAMVVSNPVTGRLVVLTNHGMRIDIRPAAKALQKRFPSTEFDVNQDRGSLVWDPRSGTTAPDPEQVAEIVDAQLVRKEEPPAQGPRFDATIGDRLRQRPPQQKQKRR